MTLETAVVLQIKSQNSQMKANRIALCGLFLAILTSIFAMYSTSQQYRLASKEFALSLAQLKITTRPQIKIELGDNVLHIQNQGERVAYNVEIRYAMKTPGSGLVDIKHFPGEIKFMNHGQENTVPIPSKLAVEGATIILTVFYAEEAENSKYIQESIDTGEFVIKFEQGKFNRL